MERQKPEIETRNCLLYQNIPFRILSFLTANLVTILVCLIFPVLFGHKTKGRRNLKGIKAGILVSNHCFYLDPGFIAKAIFPRAAYFSIQEETISVKGFGFFLKLLRGFALPDSSPMSVASTTSAILQKGKQVHFFPEGVLYDYNQNITPYQSGAFYFAARYGIPVIPVTNVISKRRLFGKELPKPFIKATTVISPAVYPLKGYGDLRDKAKLTAETVRDIQQREIDENNGDKGLFEGKIEHRI